MIPGIDMVNHSTDESLRNTSLHRREETKQQDAPPAAPSPAPAPEPAPALEGVSEGGLQAEGAAVPEAAPTPSEVAEKEAVPVAAPVITSAFFTMEAGEPRAQPGRRALPLGLPPPSRGCVQGLCTTLRGCGRPG